MPTGRSEYKNLEKLSDQSANKSKKSYVTNSSRACTSGVRLSEATILRAAADRGKVLGEGSITEHRRFLRQSANDAKRLPPILNILSQTRKAVKSEGESTIAVKKGAPEGPTATLTASKNQEGDTQEAGDIQKIIDPAGGTSLLRSAPPSVPPSRPYSTSATISSDDSYGYAEWK